MLQRGWPVDDEEEARQKRLRMAFSLANSLHFDDDDRHDLARMVVGVDRDGDGSWRPLTMSQLHDLITMMEGYLWIAHMKGQRNSSKNIGYPS